MIIVGSRCGGFDFYAKKQNDENFVWLGPTENSDVDLFSNEKYYESLLLDQKQLEKFKLPNFWHKHEFPFKINGELYVPKNKIYLCWAIKKRFKLSLKQCFFEEGNVYNIFDRSKNFLFDIKFVYIGRFSNKVKL